MATNEIEISLSINGAKQAENQIEKVEKASINLSDSAKGVGETFSSVSEAVEKSGGLMAGGFAAVGDSVMSAAEGIVGFSEAAKIAGETGGKAWLGMLGPLALLISAVASTVEAIREFTGAAREAEMWEEAMSATASDLTSRMEALAETGLIPTNKELESFIKLNQQARFSLEILGLENEKLVKVYKQQDDAIKAISDAKKQLTLIETQNAKATKVTELSFVDQVKSLPDLISQLWGVDDATDTLHDSQIELDKANQKIIESEKELARVYKEEVIPRLQAALRAQEVATKTQLQLEDDYYAKLKEVEDAEIKALDLQDKSTAATLKVGQAVRQLISEQKKRLDKETALNYQLEKGIIDQQKYQEELLILKETTYDQTKALDDLIESRNRELRQLEADQETKNRLAEASSKAADAANAREEKAFNRRIELLNREKSARDGLVDVGTLYKLKQVSDAILRESASAVSDLKKSLFEIGGLGSGADDPITRAGEKRLEVLKYYQDVEIKILNENLINQLRIDARIKADRNKISEDAIAYLEELGAKAKGKNKTIIQEMIVDYNYSYEAIKKAKERFVTEQIISNMELLKNQIIAGKQEALADQEQNITLVENDRKVRKQLIDSEISYYSGLFLRRTMNENRALQIEIDSYNKRKAFQLKSLNERIDILDKEAEYQRKIDNERAKIDPNYFVDESFLDRELQRIDQRKRIQQEIQILNTQALIDEQNFANKQRKIQEDILVYNKTYSDDKLHSLKLMFTTEQSIREEANRIVKEQEIERLKNATAILNEGIQSSLAVVENARRVLEELQDAPIENLSKKQKTMLDQAETILDTETMVLNSALLKREQLIEESNKRIALLQEESRDKNIAAATEEWRTIGAMLMDFYTTQVQAVASGLGQVFFDDTADQKLKELEANRKSAMDQYKTDMKARAEIEKQYLQQKRAIQAEDEQAISNMLKATLRAAAQEALVKSIFHTGMGIGALAMGPLGGMSAAGHFKAAAVFAGLAAVAGLSSKAAGAPVSASASTSLSPTGASQTTTSPIRETARNTEPIVFNINLAGATVYDTRAAAEQAMADRIVSMASRARRGAYNAFSR